ncbi:MAG: hypothetical protein ABFS32_11510 [Bacteroidota bacterium]
MEKTILIGTNNNFSATTNKWLFSITGIILILLGTRMVWTSDWEIVGIMFIVAGLHQVFFGLMGFSEKSKYALRFKVTDSLIEYRDAFLKPTVQVNWNEIVKIRLDDDKVIFSLTDKNETFKFRSNMNACQEIKEMLKGIAEEKDIPLADS